MSTTLLVVSTSATATSRVSVPKCMAVTAVARLKGSKAVFIGRVNEIHNSDQTQIVKFHVTKSWKYIRAKEVKIVNQVHHESPYFRQAHSYLVYANEYHGMLTTGVCSGTIEVEYARNEIKALDTWKARNQTPVKERHVRKAVESFYEAFNSHGWSRAAEFTTDDWNHINPFGGRTRGRSETVSDLNEVHSTFLKGVSDTVEEMDVRFASSNVAIVTVISRVGTYTTPEGTKHENERHLRTFVVVKRNGRWLIMHDHNTIVEP